MKKTSLTYILLIFIAHCSLLIAHCSCQTLQQIESSRISLPNGWKITPVGKSLELGDLPLNIAVSHSKKLLAVTNNGFGEQTIQLMDAKKQKILDNVKIGKSWVGLAFTSDDKQLFASGGNDNFILRYNIINKQLKLKDTIILGKPWPIKISPAGIAYDDKKQLLYVVTKENNSLYVIDVRTKQTINKLELGGEGYTCLLSPKNHSLYISCWGCHKVLIFDTELQLMKSAIDVGEHPNELCISDNEQYLYVANASDNTVSVINLTTNKVIELLDAALYPNAPNGSTTNSVALSENNKTLYIANADNNCLAVFEYQQARLF